MGKLISYALFSHPSALPFERLAYVRGFYFNARMNNLMFPDWRTHLEVDRVTHDEFAGLFKWLIENNNLDIHVNEVSPLLCEGMIWRMKPVWTADITHVLCRDCDSITTYREAQCVQQWLESDYHHHAINDNPAHGGLMGGMVGFETAHLKSIMGWTSWEQMISGYNLSERGSDQQLMNERMGKYIAPSTMLHKIQGAGFPAGRIISEVPLIRLPQVDPTLWESNLVCRHIGSAGVVDMEVLRYFKRWDAYDWKYQPIEKEFSRLFYWQQ